MHERERLLPAGAVKLCAVVNNIPCQDSYNLPEYCRKDVADQAWQEVSEEMNEAGLSANQLVNVSNLGWATGYPC
jgi:uncharacterized Fe-S center protein